MNIHVAASVPTPTITGVRDGLDVDVTVTVDGEELQGGVTLAPDHRGVYVAYGNVPDMWVSDGLLNELQCREVSLREVLNKIEAAASTMCAAV